MATLYMGYVDNGQILAKLLKRKVGTGEIEAAGKKNVFGEDALDAIRCKRVEKEVVRILRLRIQTANKKIKWNTLQTQASAFNAIVREASQPALRSQQAIHAACV